MKKYIGTKLVQATPAIRKGGKIFSRFKVCIGKKVMYFD